jgi:hypothetical protein
MARSLFSVIAWLVSFGYIFVGLRNGQGASLLTKRDLLKLGALAFITSALVSVFVKLLVEWLRG